MIDVHDRCEWVNVSSGTGSPRLFRTKSREPLNGCGYVSMLLFAVVCAVI